MCKSSLGWNMQAWICPADFILFFSSCHWLTVFHQRKPIVNEPFLHIFRCKNGKIEKNILHEKQVYAVQREKREQTRRNKRPARAREYGSTLNAQYSAVHTVWDFQLKDVLFILWGPHCTDTQADMAKRHYRRNVHALSLSPGRGYILAFNKRRRRKG